MDERTFNISGKWLLLIGSVLAVLLMLQFLPENNDSVSRMRKATRFEVTKTIWLQLQLLNDDYEIIIEEITELGYDPQIHDAEIDKISKNAIRLEVYCQEHYSTVPRELTDELSNIQAVYSTFLTRLRSNPKQVRLEDLGTEILSYRLWFNKVATMISEMFDELQR